MNVATTTILELCAGVGMLGEGFAAGLRHIGRTPRVMGYVERDAYAAAALLARMASKALEPAPVWAGNLEDVRWERWAGAVDCVLAGFPCQPHSHAGSRKGTDDSRWIWPAITDCIRLVRPSIVWLENVAGLRSSGGMAPVLADLAALGFRVEWDSVRASDVGASHQRERVFILAYSERNGRNAWWSEQPGREQRGTDADGAGCAFHRTGSVDDSNGSERWPLRIGGSGCQQGPHGEREEDCRAGIAGSACMGDATRQRLGETRDCGGAQHAGTGEHGAELAKPGCLRTGEDEPQSVAECSHPADDCACCSIVADAGQQRSEGREQHGTHVADGRTDGFTI